MSDRFRVKIQTGSGSRLLLDRLEKISLCLASIARIDTNYQPLPVYYSSALSTYNARLSNATCFLQTDSRANHKRKLCVRDACAYRYVFGSWASFYKCEKIESYFGIIGSQAIVKIRTFNH